MGIEAAVIGSMLVSAHQTRKSAKAAERQHQETLRTQEAAEDEAQARDRARAMEQVETKSATTKYGVKKKPVMSAADDLLIAPREASVDLGFGTGKSKRTGLGF